MFKLLEQILRPNGCHVNLDAPVVTDRLRQCEMLGVVEEYRYNASSDEQAIDALLDCLRRQELAEAEFTLA